MAKNLGNIYAEQYGTSVETGGHFAKAIATFLETKEVEDQIRQAAGLKRDAITICMLCHETHVRIVQYYPNIVTTHLFVEVADTEAVHLIKYHMSKHAADPANNFWLDGNKPYDARETCERMARAYNLAKLEYTVEVGPTIVPDDLNKTVDPARHLLTLTFKQNDFE